MQDIVDLKQITDVKELRVMFSHLLNLIHAHIGLAMFIWLMVFFCYGMEVSSDYYFEDEDSIVDNE